jgi:para-aminobenzoate synthetase/4-amino-4-deoxychorismate lyase
MELSEVKSAIASAQSAASEGKWVAGYVAYEAASAFDDGLRTAPSDGRPLAWFGVFDTCVEEPIVLGLNGQASAYDVSPWQRGVTPVEYAGAFDAIREAIRRGDAYQVNLTFPLHAAFTGDAPQLYRDLIRSQRPAYAAYLNHEDTHVVSVSPERFFAVDAGRISTRPMKGTARRGRWGREDSSVREALQLSEKDRAENLMIVDLIRNDLGRIAEFGSVTVEELFAVERFETLWQMTSTVSAELRQDVELVDIFGALFPCGSVTGAPKASSMDVITEVEREPRGVYCGAIGFIPPGNGVDGASFNVAIRTATIDAGEGVATYGVGGGITWYSTRESEYEETATKALVLTRRAAPDSLIETVRWNPDPIGVGGSWLWLDEHLGRLASSADYWGFAYDDLSVRTAVGELSQRLDYPARVRIEVTREDAISCITAEAPDRFSFRPGIGLEPVVLALSGEPIDSADPRVFHKLGDRAAYDRRAARHPDVDDVALVNEHGHITETTIANLVFLVEGVWMTPPIEDGLLPGIMRQRLIDEGFVKAGSVTVEDALAAEAMAVINSVRGWRPATWAEH